VVSPSLVAQGYTRKKMSQEDEYETLPQSSVATNMMAGALAGIAEHIAMYPLDSVKVTQCLFIP
jgi:hypothetical protein